MKIDKVLRIGDRINTIGELREMIAWLDDKDQICIETIDDEGNAQDLYPMYVDVIEGIELLDGTEIREVRFCQMSNTINDLPFEQPDTNDVISTTEFDDFIDTWGQTELDYDIDTGEDVLLDYFWIEKEKQWFPKQSSMYTEREQVIADYLRTNVQ